MLSIRATAATEFKREYLYKMYFDPTMVNRVNKALSVAGMSLTTKDKIDLDYLNKDAVFSSKISEMENFFWKGTNHYVPKNPNTSGESDFVFFDDANNNAEAILTVFFNESTFLNDSNSYIGIIYIDEYDIDKKTVLRQAQLLNCHLTTMTHGTRKKDSADISYITAHITWDYSATFVAFKKSK